MKRLEIAQILVISLILLVPLVLSQETTTTTIPSTTTTLPPETTTTLPSTTTIPFTTTTITSSCPPAPTPPTCSANQYLYYNYDSQGCLTGYECRTSATTTTIATSSCPTAPTPPTCTSGQYLKYNYDSQGCVVSYTCQTTITCPTPPPYPTCPSGQYAQSSYDSNNCVISYTCQSTTSQCGDKVCSGGETPSSCPGDCGTSTSETCGNNFCGSGETPTSCASDCRVCGDGPISSSGCQCGSVTQYGGYCCNSVFQSSACGTSGGLNNPCGEGPIPSSGCNCGGGSFYSGYCCYNVYQASACTGVTGGYCGDKACNNAETPTSCPSDCGGGATCSSSNYWYCYDQSSCTGAGAKWCSNQYSGGYCTSTTSTCPSYVCESSNVWNCKTESECKSAGGNWYNNYCSSSPPPQCSSSQLYNCYDQTNCKTSGGNWCNNYCTSASCPTCSSSQKYNCYTESECSGAAGRWCATGGNGYCSDSCPTCSKDQLWNCYDETSCKSEAGNWCKSPGTNTGWCSSSSCPSYTCEKANPWNCYSQSDCSGVGGNWCVSSGTTTGWCSSTSCPTTSIGYCGWCGDSCTRITPTMFCQNVVPPSGFKCLEENGACVKKAYDFNPPPTCPVVPAFQPCPAGEFSKPTFDVNNCITGYKCVAETGVGFCPQTPPPTITCLPPDQLTKVTNHEGCVINYYCASTGPPGGLCPNIAAYKPQCTDGSLVPIFDNNGCSIGYNCIPSGCRQETDPNTQVTRVVCEQAAQCQSQEEILSIGNKCISQGGKVASFTDYSGCKFIDCKFTDEEIQPDPLTGLTECVNPTKIDNAVKACKATGLFPAISFEGGCKVVKCLQHREERCKIPTPDEKAQLDNQCSAKGLPIVRDFNSNGCAFYRCGETQDDTCAKEVPPEAFTKCQAVGGEMIVKKDDNSCVVYAKCITRGDERDSYVEPIEEVPDSTELLQIVLKLEQLKVELQKLADQAENIAAFYEGRGDDDEERYNRVSSMFESAGDRIDEIKARIRDSLDSLTVEDVIEIKRDIKHLKDVTVKDIVYFMLSNSDEVKQTIKASKKLSAKTAKIEDVEREGDNCGTDGLCFDRAFRVCDPVTFKPEGSSGPTITVAGLDGDVCVVKARMSGEGIPVVGGLLEMTCRFSEYSFGVSGPQDFLPNCEGPMADMMRQFGGPGAVTSGAEFPPPEGGPGGCTEITQCAQYCLDNYDDCVQWTEEHPAYGSPPPRGELERIARGESPEEFKRGPGGSRGPVSFEGPGGCKGPKECDKFCSSNPQVCQQWCAANPDVCPQENLRGPPAEHEEGFGQQHGGIKCPDGICDAFEQANPNACPQDCGGFGVSQPQEVQACAGCLNNHICDIGECSECIDCLKR
ncbi:MAG: hypothetical protein HY361_05085 [Candidatus Aenigmarchaeota archaeon]|nr:hypothetical protein [Candidatus Aenigmarchaeota archaeon]